MELLRQILLVLHILGFAALIGGLLAQADSAEKKVNGAMRDGVGGAFLAGLALVGVLQADDQDVDNTKIAVKGVIGLVLLVLVMANVRKERIPSGLGWPPAALRRQRLRRRPLVLRPRLCLSPARTCNTPSTRLPRRRDGVGVSWTACDMGQGRTRVGGEA